MLYEPCHHSPIIPMSYMCLALLPNLPDLPQINLSTVIRSYLILSPTFTLTSTRRLGTLTHTDTRCHLFMQVFFSRFESTGSLCQSPCHVLGCPSMSIKKLNKIFESYFVYGELIKKYCRENRKPLQAILISSSSDIQVLSLPLGSHPDIQGTLGVRQRCTWV